MSLAWDLAVEGMNAAAENAERDTEGWNKMAFEVFVRYVMDVKHPFMTEDVRCFAKALAQERSSDEQPAQQEPVAWKHDCAALLTNDVELWIDQCPHCGKPRTPPQPAQRTWVGLTEDEIIRCTPTWGGTVEDVAIAIEAKLKAKNSP